MLGCCIQLVPTPYPNASPSRQRLPRSDCPLSAIETSPCCGCTCKPEFTELHYYSSRMRWSCVKQVRLEYASQNDGVSIIIRTSRLEDQSQLFCASSSTFQLIFVKGKSQKPVVLRFTTVVSTGMQRLVLSTTISKCSAAGMPSRELTLLFLAHLHAH